MPWMAAAVHFASPRDALDRGISAVYQTLAMVPLLSVWRNFFLGSEITCGIGPFRRLDVAAMWTTTDAELRRMGINVADLEQPVGTLSGGQRQVVAIARAIHFGARVLILDEPTAALGVTQSGIVLRYIAAAAREQGIGVIFITHNPHHAYMVGDHFMVLARGEVELDTPRARLSLDDLMFHMAGGAGLNALQHELHRGERGCSGQFRRPHVGARRRRRVRQPRADLRGRPNGSPLRQLGCGVVTASRSWVAWR